MTEAINDNWFGDDSPENYHSDLEVQPICDQRDCDKIKLK